MKHTVRIRCPSCSNTFCLACGEPVIAERDQTSRLVLDDNPLYHCANMQGVILGVGLSMLEQMFLEQVRDAGSSSTSRGKPDSNSKKRKAGTTSTPQPIDVDDDDDVYYARAKGKKARGGVGYAGDLREDVSQIEV